MSYLEELLPQFRNGAKIRCNNWNVGNYLYIQKDGTILDEKECKYKIHGADLLCNGWELYQEPIDWDYIIKNKCLCWFWDDDEKCRTVGILADFMLDGTYIRDDDCYYDNCRPICKYEITFYEDKDNG